MQAIASPKTDRSKKPMNVISNSASMWQPAALRAPRPFPTGAAATENRESDEQARSAFRSFVGETLFGQLLKAMRKTVGKPAYFHGGRAEEIFSQQLDQVLAEKIANADGAKYSDAMYALFTMQRS